MKCQAILFTAEKDIETYFPETRTMNGVDRDKYFILALNKHLTKLQEAGARIISIGYSSGAYAERSALIALVTE